MRLGQDVEIFLQNDAGKHISVIGMIGADKWNPMQIPDMAKGFTLQEDNVALEYGMPPAATPEEWDTWIQAVMDKSKEYVRGLSFSNLSATIFDRDQMRHPAAHKFGCEPDFNAWTGETNPSPQPPHPFLRSAGGHIHIETQEDPLAVIRSADLFLGVPSVLMDAGELRKQIYGKAGAHRKKSYGPEYRTLSNFWALKSETRLWVWRNMERALANLGVAEHVGDLVQQAINENDKSVAEYLVHMFDLEVV